MRLVYSWLNLFFSSSAFLGRHKMLSENNGCPVPTAQPFCAALVQGDPWLKCGQDLSFANGARRTKIETLLANFRGIVSVE